MNVLEIVLLDDVQKFILGLPISDQQKISASLNALREKQFECIYIKSLRGDIKELKIKKYRLIFFIVEPTVYIVTSFIKKTAKTPQKEIEVAEKIQKLISKK